MTIKLVPMIAALRPWPRVGVAFIAGACGALAFQPFGLIPLLWVSFPALFLLLQGTTSVRAAFAVGWSFALGFLVVCMHWIASALLVDLQAFWWALPFAVFGLPSFFALYYGAMAALSFIWGLKKAEDVFFFAFCWFMADMARAYGFTGFPWDMVGYVWADTLSMLQSVSVVGVEGLTLLTLVLAVLPALFFTDLSRGRTFLACLAGVFLLGGVTYMGFERLEKAPEAFVKGPRLRLVQPQLAQALKWEPERRLINFQNLMRLTFETKADAPITHYIWPETATAYYLAEESGMRARIAEAMPKGTVLLTGVVRREKDQDNAPTRYFNSLVAMDDKGTLVAGYDKFHLVPFGEFMPFRHLIPFRVITALGVDFTAGEGVRTVHVPNLPSFSPLICYEAIFSGAVAEREDRPRFLLNVTNDAWYQGTIGPLQHFMITRVRAVEEGLPLVRVANGGMTGVVDAYGRITALTGEGYEGIVDTPLPESALHRTFMSVFGIFGAATLFIVGLLPLFLLRFYFRSRNDTDADGT